MISADVLQLIYAHIDSVEQLEILLLLHASPGKIWTAQTISSELRTNPSSVEARVLSLVRAKIIYQNPSSREEFYYSQDDPVLDKTISELKECHRVMRHKIYELIFSPLKKARTFGDSFRIGDPKKGGDGNG